MRDEEAKTGKSIPGSHELAVDKDGKVISMKTMFPDNLPGRMHRMS